MSSVSSENPYEGRSSASSDAVKVLLIAGAGAEASGITRFLESESPYFSVFHFTDSPAALDFLRRHSVDIILLHFGLIAPDNAKDIFHNIQNKAPYTPIIIFTGESEHDLALVIVKEGAADNITQEEFHASPRTLRDAIEFSLARNERLKTGAHVIIRDIAKRTHAAEEYVEQKHTKKMGQALEQAAGELRQALEKAALELHKVEEQSTAELRTAINKGAATLNEEAAKRLSTIRHYNQIISWLGGGYSVEKGNAEEEVSEDVT